MAEQEHTAGPWEVDPQSSETENGEVYVVRSRAKGAGARWIADVAIKDGGESMGNAALIAAAPDQHKQLNILAEAIRAHLDPEHCAHDKIDWADLLKSTNVVIAKATP